MNQLSTPPISADQRSDLVDRKNLSILRRAIGAVSNLIYPPNCTFCEGVVLKSDDRYMLCGDCRDLLYDADSPRCRRCGRIVPALQSYQEKCSSCRSSKFSFHSVFCVGNYSDELREAVLRTKNPAGQYLAAELSHLLAINFSETIHSLQVDIVVPIAMHWKRRMNRGHNNAEVMAQQISRKLKISAIDDLLRRKKNTKPQAELSPRQRVENMRGAFKVSSKYKLQKTKVLLVDDILTTGATCHEASRMLKKAGAAEVYVAVIARAIGK